MKAYKIELLVLDFDQLGGDEIKSVLENARYSNHCISPSVMNISEVDIGPWSDENPLNSGKTRAAEYARIFTAEAPIVASNGDRQALEKAAAALQQFKRDWMAVPAFADRVNKSTRDAISRAIGPLVNLDAVGGPLDLSSSK